MPRPSLRAVKNARSGLPSVETVLPAPAGQPSANDTPRECHWASGRRRLRSFERNRRRSANRSTARRSAAFTTEICTNAGMAEWIYFLHAPRENFAETMTDEETEVWGVHFERFQRLLDEGVIILVG